MHLRSITLEGYRSAPHGKPLIMERLGRFNILIGPNNSGKSTVLRFLQVVASQICKKSDMPIRLPWDQVDRSWWWQSNVEHPIKATLVFSTPAPEHELDSKAAGRFEHDGEWRVSITISANPPEDCLILVAPNVHIKGAWHPIIRMATNGSATIENLNRAGDYISSASTDACPYRQNGIAILGAWARGTRFYDPVRAIDRQAGRRGLADGSDLLEKIRMRQFDQKQAYAFEQFRKKLIGELNELLFDKTATNPIESFEIKGDDRLDLYIKRRSDEAPIALQYMGTGISELTILLSDILQSEDAKQYFIEEPECHLHPGLLRRLVRRIRSLSSAQLFITTHSNAVLDSTTIEDGIYRFGLAPGVGTAVQRCGDVVEQASILDALGVNGSALLQTNCVLWVEGPSDRIYLKWWIQQRCIERQLSLLEGIDFSFVYYGGKILSHFAFSDSGPDELVAMIRICRYSAVFMDRDTAPNDPAEEIRDVKARIRDEAQKDPHHRLVALSIGREIENDVDPVLFRKAVAKLIGVDDGDLSGMTISGSNRYPDEVLAHLKPNENSSKTMRRRLKDKVTLAKLLVEERIDGKSVPGYVDELIELIDRSRLT